VSRASGALVHGHEDVVEMAPMLFGEGRQGRDLLYESFGQCPQFDVRLLRAPGQDLEGAIGRDGVRQHESTLGLFDDGTGVRQGRHRSVDGYAYVLLEGVGEVEIEAGGAENGAVLVEDAVADDGYLSDPPPVSMIRCRLLKGSPVVRTDERRVAMSSLSSGCLCRRTSSVVGTTVPGS